MRRRVASVDCRWLERDISPADWLNVIHHFSQIHALSSVTRRKTAACHERTSDESLLLRRLNVKTDTHFIAFYSFIISVTFCLLLLLNLFHLVMFALHFRPRRSRSAAAYSHQTFPWTICRSVCLSSALWKNGESDPDAVWHHRSDGSRDEAGSAVWGSAHVKGYFWGRIWGAPL